MKQVTLLRIRNFGVTCEPRCYLTFPAWFRWTDNTCACKKKNCNNYVEKKSYTTFHNLVASRDFYMPGVSYSHHTSNNFPEPHWPTEFCNGQELCSLWWRDVIIIYNLGKCIVYNGRLRCWWDFYMPGVSYSHHTSNNFPEPHWPTEFCNGQGLCSLWWRDVIIIYNLGKCIDYNGRLRCWWDFYEIQNTSSIQTLWSKLETLKNRFIDGHTLLKCINGFLP